jgi:hypothetical protein
VYVFNLETRQYIALPLGDHPEMTVIPGIEVESLVDRKTYP